MCQTDLNPNKNSFGTIGFGLSTSDCNLISAYLVHRGYANFPQNSMGENYHSVREVGSCQVTSSILWVLSVFVIPESMAYQTILSRATSHGAP